MVEQLAINLVDQVECEFYFDQLDRHFVLCIQNTSNQIIQNQGLPAQLNASLTVPRCKR